MPRAGAARHHEFVLFGLNQCALLLQVFHHGFTRYKAVHAAVGFGGFVVDGGIEVEHANHGQLVALAYGVVVGIVRGGNFDYARTKGAVHIRIGNHGYGAAYQRQGDGFAYQVLVAFVFGVYHHGHVAQHGFGAGGGYGEAACAIAQGIGNVPQKAVFFFAFYFQIAYGGFEHGVPVHQAFATVNQALFVQAHEGIGHHGGEFVVHGEVFAAPVYAGTHAAHLVGDGVAAFFFPFPDFGNEVFTRLCGRVAHVVAADALGLQLALHHDLRGNASMVCARYPRRVVAAHTVVAREAIHNGLVKGVPHVQRACHVGRGQLDAEVLPRSVRLRTRLACAALPCCAVAALLPQAAPALFKRGGFKGFGQALKAGLCRGSHGRQSIKTLQEPAAVPQCGRRAKG